MDWTGLGIAIVFGFLAFAVKQMPPAIAWGGIAGGLVLLFWSHLPVGPNYNGPLILGALAFVLAIAGLAWAISIPTELQIRRAPIDIASNSNPPAARKQTARSALHTNVQDTQSRSASTNDTRSSAPRSETPLHIHATTNLQSSISKAITRAPRHVGPSGDIEKPDVLLVYEGERLVLYNKGQKNFFLAGDRLQNTDADFSSPPVIVPKGGYYFLYTDRLKERALSVIGANGQQRPTFEMYFWDQDKVKKFTGKFALLITMKEGSMDIAAQNFGVTDDPW